MPYRQAPIAHDGTIRYHPRKIIRHDIPGKSPLRGRNIHFRKLAQPDVGQTSVLVADGPEILPPHSQIEGEPRVYADIVLHEGAEISKPVAVNDAIRPASDAKQALKDVAKRSPVRAARIIRTAE